MTAIDKDGLARAMDFGGCSSKQLADDLGISPQYVCDMLAGRRTLKRNPELRARIAKTLDVPRRWIETPEAAA